MPKPSNVDPKRHKDICQVAEQLVSVATDRAVDRLSREPFALCHMCGELDAHTFNCPIPKVIRWLADWTAR